MKIESVKLLLDVCAEAGHMENMLPALPKGITPRCIRVIEQVALLSQRDGRVRVSSISEMLDVTRPGITAVLQELNAAGYVDKAKDEADSRVVYVSLTDRGWALYRSAVEEYHAHLAEVLSEIGDEGAQTLAALVRRSMALVAQDTKNRNADASGEE
ncbi:MAG: winged helix DNA-binding protein [Clostridia bacterium]|nr:winged helix DNA-binding protein [Clostridia bacterium]